MKFRKLITFAFCYFTFLFAEAQESKLDISFSGGVGIPMGRMGTPGNEAKFATETLTDGTNTQTSAGTIHLPYGLASTGFNMDLQSTWSFSPMIGLTASVKGLFNSTDEAQFKKGIDLYQP